MGSLITLVALVVAGPIVQSPSPEHPAWDIACKRGAPVYAVFDGTLRAHRSARMGNQITLEGNHHTAYYAHLQSVLPASEVMKGDVIGTCGSTGTWSYGPHVHFEVK